ncbi:MAG TPA: class I SAM-dependent methyltransferase [Euzebyales bacterium]|nr:class I SAM-dependent methyltransferase [Euzebyales bacterium]
MATQRNRIEHQVRYALAHPERVVPHLRRLARNLALGVRHRDHVGFYRQVMRHNVAADPDLAVGSASRKRWLELGKAQFDFLTANGLDPTHHMLEIGCGNLRGGWRFIDYLGPGQYTGIDISPDVLFAAQRTLVDFDLQDKQPRLTPVQDLTLSWLPTGRFDVVHAHSVFSHCPVDVISECFANVRRVMAPKAFFDFTYNRTEGRPHQVLREDYYYRTEQLADLAEAHGFDAEPRDDWTGNRQAKMRLRLR